MYLSPGLLLMGCPRISSDLGFPSLVGCAVKMTVLSKKQATTYQPQGKAILIGITDFGGFPEEYAGTFVDVLRLQFDDIDHEMDPERFGVFKLFDSFQAGIVTSLYRYTLIYSKNIFFRIWNKKSFGRSMKSSSTARRGSAGALRLLLPSA